MISSDQLELTQKTLGGTVPPARVPLAADRSGLGVLDEVDPDFHLDWFQSPRSSPYRLHSLLDWRKRAPTQASSSCVSIALAD